MSTSLLDVPGIQAGHATDLEGVTGCTVVLAGPQGAVAGVDVRGSAPGTRETDLLRATATVERVHAVCLCGGSAFGLAAADGVMRYLSERGIGFDAGVARVPIVPAAVIFDLAIGSAAAHPGPDDGYAACLAAARHGPLAEGSVGVGTGATVGKLLAAESVMKGGVGTAAVRLPGGARVGALAAVNALGDVVDARGGVLAGARSPKGGFLNSQRALLTGAGWEPRPSGANTTIAVVATDARLTKAQCQKLAELSQDALAICIRPVHTSFDGDTVFALSTGEVDSDLLSLGAAAVAALSEAIRRGVRLARGLGGVPGLADG